MHLHLLTQDPGPVVGGPVVALTSHQIKTLEGFLPHGGTQNHSRNYFGQQLTFDAHSLLNHVVTFPSPTQLWQPVSHWMVIDTPMNGALKGQLSILGHGPFLAALVVDKGDVVEMPAQQLCYLSSLYRVDVAAGTGCRVPLRFIPGTPPAPPAQAPVWVNHGPSGTTSPASAWAAPNPPAPSPVMTKSYWTTPRCECGAEKTWGPNAGGHSSWCPKARR